MIMVFLDTLCTNQITCICIISKHMYACCYKIRQLNSSCLSCGKLKGLIFIFVIIMLYLSVLVAIIQDGNFIEHVIHNANCHFLVLNESLRNVALKGTCTNAGQMISFFGSQLADVRIVRPFFWPSIHISEPVALYSHLP